MTGMHRRWYRCEAKSHTLARCTHASRRAHAMQVSGRYTWLCVHRELHELYRLYLLGVGTRQQPRWKRDEPRWNSRRNRRFLHRSSTSLFSVRRSSDIRIPRPFPSLPLSLSLSLPPNDRYEEILWIVDRSTVESSSLHERISIVSIIWNARVMKVVRKKCDKFVERI